MKIGIFKPQDFLVDCDSNLTVIMDRTKRPRFMRIPMPGSVHDCKAKWLAIWKLVKILDVEQSFSGLGYILKTVGIVKVDSVTVRHPPEKDPGS